jgi:membrane protein DedA with SNARE-associated domain
MLTSLATYGYLILAFYSFGGGMGALIGASILSAMGKMDIAASVAVASVSNYIGSNFLFYMAQTNKHTVKGYISKFKGRIHARSVLLMRRYGWMAVFVHKYIYGVKTLIPIILGISRYDLRKFLIINFFASLLWGVVVGLTGYFFSAVIGKWFA